MTEGFSDQQLEQIKDATRAAVHEAMEDIGFRMDSDHKESTRDTIGFLFRLKRMWDNSVNKVGSSILTAVIAIVFGIMALGFWQWIKSGGQ